MRSIGLVILIFVAFSWAEETPPPPREMIIYMKDGTTTNVLCSRVDPGVGVTFLDNGMRMKVGLRDAIPNTFPVVYDQSNLWYYTSQIDSITFNLIAPPESSPTP
jgi:hypothetical protein